jgi:hypothetical protein
MVPLLEDPRTNPHATLITLFMNAVDENLTQQDKMASMTPQSVTTKRLLKYLPRKAGQGALVNASDPAVIKFSCARDSVDTYDHVFDR